MAQAFWPSALVPLRDGSSTWQCAGVSLSCSAAQHGSQGRRDSDGGRPDRDDARGRARDDLQSDGEAEERGLPFRHDSMGGLGVPSSSPPLERDDSSGSAGGLRIGDHLAAFLAVGDAPVWQALSAAIALSVSQDGGEGPRTPPPSVRAGADSGAAATRATSVPQHSSASDSQSPPSAPPLWSPASNMESERTPPRHAAVLPHFDAVAHSKSPLLSLRAPERAEEEITVDTRAVAARTVSAVELRDVALPASVRTLYYFEVTVRELSGPSLMAVGFMDATTVQSMREVRVAMPPSRPSCRPVYVRRGGAGRDNCYAASV
jgi:hypothetical protein